MWEAKALTNIEDFGNVVYEAGKHMGTVLVPPFHPCWLNKTFLGRTMRAIKRDITKFSERQRRSLIVYQLLVLIR